jgi:transglutaminase-like putative cysteine protease
MDTPPASNPNSRTAPAPRTSWILVAILAAAAIAGGVLAWKYRERAKAAEARLTERKTRDRAEMKPTEFERRYLEALADRYGLAHEKSWTLHETLAFTAQLNQELNARTPSLFDPARTPWLLPVPRTFHSRALSDAKVQPLDLRAGRVDLPENAPLFQYTITNISTAPVPMPILFQDVRWDSAEALTETSGLRAIADEIDRAIAVWRFVAERRCHGQPVTEGTEEHDLIKLLACYGYGFCDDSAQAVATLASACGLKARIRGLGGHVVPEILAGGHWRMLDPDFAVYFHAPGDPRAVLGVDELVRERAAFAHARPLGAGGPWDQEYAAPFLSVEDNRDWPLDGRREHVIDHTLLPGESVSFSNYNWGRYFVGAFPHKAPRFYNGSFGVPVAAALLQADPGVSVRADGSGFVIDNPSSEPAGATAAFRFPFPIVGGRVSPLPGEGTVEFIEGNRRVALTGQGEAAFDAAVTQLAATPTYAFSLRFIVPAKRRVRFERPPRVIADFQFAEFALLKLKPGTNTFRVHGPTEGLKAELRTQ